MRKFKDGKYQYRLSRNSESNNEKENILKCKTTINYFNTLYRNFYESEKIFSNKYEGYEDFNAWKIVYSLVEVGISYEQALDITYSVIKKITDKDFKIVQNLFQTAIKHQDLIKSPIHLGCIYFHLGQLYDSATRYIQKHPQAYYKGAINYYRYAQKYLSKYNYPYDYGCISYKLAHLFYNYWRQKEDLQALRDAVFNLREAEKIFTHALFPEFWAAIQNELGHMLSLLGSLTNSSEISEVAVNSFKNCQKVVTERREPLEWAKIQEEIGEIYYRLGRNNEDNDNLEEALEYFHDALYIYENMEMEDAVKRLTSSISKTSRLINN